MEKVDANKNQQDYEDVYIIKDIKQGLKKQKIRTEYQIQKDPEFDNIKIQIVNIQCQVFFKIQTQFYEIQVINTTGIKWRVQRRYSQFQWLYNALKINFAGQILPYFPNKSIESFLISKLNIEYGNSKKIDSLLQRQKDLNLFLKGLTQHQIIKYSQQLKIFLITNQNQFNKKKKIIDKNIGQIQSAQSASNSIVSIFQRSLAWMTNNPIQQVIIQDIQQWKNTQTNIKNWGKIISATLENFEKLIQLKEMEINWSGPETQIDTVQILKAKVISSKQYNTILINDIRTNILSKLQYSFKKVKQIQDQLNQRQQINKIILYLKKYQSQQSRVEKLLRKKQLFENTLHNCWKQQEIKNKFFSQQLHKQFKQLWQNYCQKMQKIWR